ncbi:MAG: hypothetical protein WA112_00855 [Rugosibacter sp.]|nr:hypothetical protein [Rugosibacter sp.]
MYIIAIGWLYITLLMAATEPNFTAGVLTFTFYGLLPLGILLWLFGTPQRRRNQAMRRQEDLPAEQLASKQTGKPNAASTHEMVNGQMTQENCRNPPAD